MVRATRGGSEELPKVTRLLFSPWAQMVPGNLCGVKMVLGDQETLSNSPLPSPEGSKSIGFHAPSVELRGFHGTQ